MVRPRRAALDELVRAGEWKAVLGEIDEALLSRVMGLASAEIAALRAAAGDLRRRRTRQED